MCHMRENKRGKNVYTRVLAQSPSSCVGDFCVTVTGRPGADVMRDSVHHGREGVGLGVGGEVHSRQSECVVTCSRHGG